MRGGGWGTSRSLLGLPCRVCGPLQIVYLIYASVMVRAAVACSSGCWRPRAAGALLGVSVAVDFPFTRLLCGRVRASPQVYIDYTAYPKYLDYYNNEDYDAADAQVSRHWRDVPHGGPRSPMLPLPQRVPSALAHPLFRLQNAFINRLYYAFNVVHTINAVQYYHSWLPLGYRWYHLHIVLPDYLNMFGAGLYIYSSTFYEACYNDSADAADAPSCMSIHRLETTAAALETVAAFGWFAVWIATYPRQTPGRGWSLDDPDTWANAGIVIPSIVYLAYNVQVINDPTQYGSNFLYVTGDLLYFLGAIAYLLCALRDDGWFFFMPGGGVWSWDKRPLVLSPADQDESYAEKAAARSLAEYIAGDWLGLAVPPCCTCSGRRRSGGGGEGQSLLGGARSPAVVAGVQLKETTPAAQAAAATATPLTIVGGAAPRRGRRGGDEDDA